MRVTHGHGRAQPDAMSTRDGDPTAAGATAVPSRAAALLGLQHTVGNQAVARLLTARPLTVFVGQTRQPVARHPSPVVQRVRKYAYRDKPFESLPSATIDAWLATLPDTIANPFVINIPAGSAKVNVIATLRDQLRGYFPSGAKVGKTFGGQLELGSGLYDIAITAPSALLGTFRVAVLATGQSLRDVVAEEAARPGLISAYFATPTIDHVATRPFQDNHYSPSIPGQFGSELLAAYREKSNTLIAFDATAIGTLAAELRAGNIADTYAMAAKYTTNDYYTIVDKYLDKVKRVVAKFRYAVFYVPTDNVWKVSHFEGIADKASETELATLKERTVAFAQPKRRVSFTNDPYTVKVSAGANVTGVTLSIDGGAPMAMTQTPATQEFTYQWAAIPLGEHKLLAKATLTTGATREVLRVVTKA